MRRNLNKITHNKNLHVGVNKISFSQRRHDTTSRRQSLHGFTLVELLVVISIIALLLSILMPGLNKARALAQEVVCGNNFRQIGIATRMYLDENDGYFCWANPKYMIDLEPYLTSSTIKVDPSNASRVFKCPADKLNPKGPFYNWGRHSYAVNVYFALRSKQDWGYASEHTISRPSNVYYRTDMLWSFLGTNFFSNRERYDREVYKTMKKDVNWHGKSVNMLYFDGHVGKIGKDLLLSSSEGWDIHQ